MSLFLSFKTNRWKVIEQKVVKSKIVKKNVYMRLLEAKV